MSTNISSVSRPEFGPEAFDPAFCDPELLCPRAATGDGDGQPLVTPIVQSTTFCRDGVGSEAEHQYSRVSNPTVSALEAVLGRLEDAPPAACFSTGLAAEAALFLSVLRAGDHVVCGRGVYGGTTRLLERVLADLGVSSTFVDARSPAEVEAAVRPTTKLIFVETPSNPTLDLTDIAAVSEIARAAGALLAVDNTFLTPVLQRPLDLGADVSIYSTTKFVEGHSVALGGALVAKDEKLLERIRFLRKCTGAIQTPFNAWLTLQGVRTLALRIRRQSESAAEIAARLAGVPGVERVRHPSLFEGAEGRLAARQHLALGGDRLHGAVVAFEVAGGLEGAREVTRRLRLCRVVEHVGSVETLVTHPASMTHADVSRAEREAVGITDGLLRLSVGLEPAGAIAADLEQAIAVGVGVGVDVRRGEAVAV